MVGQRADQTCRVVAAIALAASGCSLIAPDDDHFVGGSGGSGASDAGAVEKCDPAPPCSDQSGPATVTVASDQSTELHSIVASAEAGAVIELTPGTYPMSQPLVFAKPGVTLRSSTGKPEDVTVDGRSYPGAIEINASHITLSAFTLTNAAETGAMGTVGIVVIPPVDTRIVGTRICRMVVRNAGAEHFVQVLRTPSPTNGWADCGRIEGSTFVLDGPSATAVCTVGAPSAVRVSAAWGWVVQSNAFAGFTCPASGADAGAGCKVPPFALVFADGSRDTAIDNNCIVGAGRGFGFGVEEIEAPRSYPDRRYDGEQYSHVDGVIRNNVIFGGDCYDTGIELNYARRPVVVHNTVVAGGSISYAAIDARFHASQVFVWNNLVTGGVRCRECGKLDADFNVEVATPDLATVFVDPAALDFHLLPGATAAIDTGAALEFETGVDLDGEPHEADMPDIGADELGTAAADPLTPCQRLLPAAAR